METGLEAEAVLELEFASEAGTGLEAWLVLGFGLGPGPVAGPVAGPAAVPVLVTGAGFGLETE